MQPRRKKNRRTGHFFAACVSLTALLGACQKAADEPKPPAGPNAAALLPPSAESSATACGNGAYVDTALFGSIERQIRWSAGDLQCDSMRRPDGKGVRLRFTGAAADSRLAIILALPELKRGLAMSESPTVVTLTVEGSGRFFSTPTSESCWSDIGAQEAIAENSDRFDVSGTLYCVAPLGEINGDAAISIPEMRFRGIVDWAAK